MKTYEYKIITYPDRQAVEKEFASVGRSQWRIHTAEHVARGWNIIWEKEA